MSQLFLGQDNLPIDHGMALSDPQGVVGFGRLIYPHSSALRASNESYDKSDLLAEVLIYRHSDEYNVEATSHTPLIWLYLLQKRKI